MISYNVYLFTKMIENSSMDFILDFFDFVFTFSDNPIIHNEDGIDYLYLDDYKDIVVPFILKWVSENATVEQMVGKIDSPIRFADFILEYLHSNDDISVLSPEKRCIHFKMICKPEELFYDFIKNYSNLNE